MQCTQDSSFGPASTCRGLDFTLYFEQTILSFVPDIVFIVLAGFRLWFLYHQFNKLQFLGWPLFSAKIASSLLLVAVNVASLHCLLSVQRQEKLFVWLAAPATQLASTIPLGVVVVMEHFRSPAPSMLVISYSLLKCLFSAVALRSYDQVGLLSTTVSSVGVSSVFLTASYLLLMCVELVEKRRLLRQKALSSVTTSSFLSRSVYIWLIPLLWTGRTKTLAIEDCDVIPKGLSAQSSRLKLERALMRAKTTSHYLLFGSAKAFGLHFLAPILPRMILLLATFAQPLLVTKMISFVSTPDLPTAQGWALVGGFICIYMLITLSTSLYWEKVFDATVLFRAALVGSIYSKTLKLSSSSSRSLGGGVASTYMSVDVERVCVGAEFFHEFWASLMSIALSIVLLYHQTTWPAFLPLAVTIILLVAAILIGRRVNHQQASWLAATDKRVKFMSSIIANILPIKWACYEEVLAERAAHLRGEEMEKAKQFYQSTSIMAALSNTASTFCILSVLGPYATFASNGLSPALDVNRLFTVVAIVNLLSAPLNLLGQTLPELAAAYASLMRIQTYLLLGEKPRDVSDDSVKAAAGQKVSEWDNHESIPLGMATSAITMDDASFAWTPQTDPYLRDITIHLDRPVLYICVGHVASGKSLLLLSILGESTQVGGRFAGAKGRIAYASQETLIVPGTIRENVTFGKPYRAERYALVLEACALTKDISMLPAGDRTFLGEKGRRLSGGQKQRIALARAVYADAQWTLLDDPFSALDGETEAHVFMSLFKSGGLLHGKAVLLVTHNVNHLSSASHIIVLQNGRIQTQGAPAWLEQKGHNFLTAGLAERLKQGGTQRNPAVEEPMDCANELEEVEEPIPKSSLGLTPYLFFARMATWKNTTLCIALLVLLGVLRVGLQGYLREWSISDGNNLGRWIGGYAGLSVASLLSTAFAIWQYCMVITDVSGRAIHREEVKGLFGVDPSYFLSTPAGRIINRFSQDIFLIDLVFPLGCLNGLVQSVILLGTLGLIFVPVPWLSLSIIPLGVVYYFLLELYLRTSKQLQHLEASSKSPLYTTFSTTLSGLETIRALRAECYFQDQNDTYLNRSQVPFFFRFGTIRFLRTVLALISGAVAVGLASAAVRLRNSIDPSFLGVALSNLTELLQLLSSLLLSLANVENGSIAISRIHEIISLPKEENMSVTAPPIRGNVWPSAGTVVFQDVYLRYRANLRPVLRGISFRAGAGQKIGICGRSGSGKSSIVLALYRALHTSLMAGKIKIDDVDIDTIPLSSLRKSLSLVAQDPFLWHSSLRDNLDPEHELSDHDIWLSLKRVGMSDVIASLPDKLDSVLEDKGSFSKGQCQLLCFVRVLLRERKIVILDEASSSLDFDTDKKMKEVIRTELADCTVIVIAHRIATIIDFDWILVMDDGVLVEAGKPQDLLAQPESRFARFASSQGLGPSIVQ